MVAAWQLLAVGWTRRMIRHRLETHGWRTIHAGVYVLSAAPPRTRQRRIAATLTTADSVLSHASAAACWGFRRTEPRASFVTRPGTGGRRRYGRLIVCMSSTLRGDVTRHDGVAVTTGARTLIDVAPYLSETAGARAFREALRLGATTMPLLEGALDRHGNRRGTRQLRLLAQRYGAVPYARTRSDAEALALELLHDDGNAPVHVNVRIGGEEADMVWPEERRIVEIDGPQYHRFRREDARKERAWQRAGYTVRRLPSDAVYERPEELLRLARRR